MEAAEFHFRNRLAARLGIHLTPAAACSRYAPSHAAARHHRRPHPLLQRLPDCWPRWPPRDRRPPRPGIWRSGGRCRNPQLRARLARPRALQSSRPADRALPVVRVQRISGLLEAPAGRGVPGRSNVNRTRCICIDGRCGTRGHALPFDAARAGSEVRQHHHPVEQGGVRAIAQARRRGRAYGLSLPAFLHL